MACSLVIKYLLGVIPQETNSYEAPLSEERIGSDQWSAIASTWTESVFCVKVPEQKLFVEQARF